MPKTITQRLSALERKIAVFFGGESDSEGRSKAGRKSKTKKRPVKKRRKARKRPV